MSSIQVWYITPDMDEHYDEVFGKFLPSMTVGEVVKQIQAAWAVDEKERDQPWVALRGKRVPVLLDDTMTVRELRDMPPLSKELKIILVTRDTADILFPAAPTNPGEGQQGQVQRHA